MCQRFTTSKLKAFEDLTSIGTYGFRGEALASISHIAHLQVKTRRKESSCGWLAHFSDGRLISAKPGQSEDPKPVAARVGTTITVEDLFYNIPTRRRAFRSASEEYAKILEQVGKYAVHCSGVAFSCKKQGDNNYSISVSANAGTIDRIRQIHGNGVAGELVKVEASSERWGFKAEAYVSNANYHVKKTALLLFINHRSVDSSVIKKAVEQVYATVLPKGGRPFVYLSLEIDPQRVDVNVHPTKREVNFLNEDEIVDIICGEIAAALQKVDTSRTFLTQTLLPATSASIATPATGPSKTRQDADPISTRRIPAQRSTQKTYENNLVRTDSTVRKITSMLPPTHHPHNSSSDLPELPEAPTEDLVYEHVDREPTICRLTSIIELRAEVREEMHNDLTNVFASHTFIGAVDCQRRIAAIQSGVKLYLIDYAAVCKAYFYQLGLTDFGNFGAIRFDPPLSLQELLEVAVEHEKNLPTNQRADEADFDWGEVVPTIIDQLVSRRAMLTEYFGLEISEHGELLSIPLLVKGYMPPLAKLPLFLLYLGPRVVWNEEKACFHSFLTELANFYMPEALPTAPRKEKVPTEEDDPLREDVDGAEQEGSDDPEIASRRAHIERAIEHVLFPAFKARLVATKGLLEGVVEVANLKGLYRVFERC